MSAQIEVKEREIWDFEVREKTPKMVYMPPSEGDDRNACDVYVLADLGL